ncbi:hypothetical protein ABIA14_004486 [Sinorhizobium fredii]
MSVAIIYLCASSLRESQRRLAGPGYTSEDLYNMNKVLNEADMPPLWAVRDMLSHLKLLRRKKDAPLPTKRGRDFRARPNAFFEAKAGGRAQPDNLVGRLPQSYQYHVNIRMLVERAGERAIPKRILSFDGRGDDCGRLDAWGSLAYSCLTRHVLVFVIQHARCFGNQG